MKSKQSSSKMGTWLDMSVLEGQFVTKAQVLTRLNPLGAEFRLEKVKIALIKAKADYEVLKIDFYGVLQSKDLAIAQSVEKRIKVNSGWALAEVELKEAELNLERCEVRAPIGGKIARVIGTNR